MGSKKDGIIVLHNQNYELLFKTLLQKGEKFVDPKFPPSTESISSKLLSSDIVWRRPNELHPRPHLVVNGVKGSDFVQGERGNAWFVTASAALVTDPCLFNFVIPNIRHQDYADYKFHPGIFFFRFNRQGKTYEIVIDDMLPTKKGRLVYCQSNDDGEFWSSLLEKAYAKFHGDYQCMENGRAVDALASFTGGIPENWNLTEIIKTSDIYDNKIKDKTFRLLSSFVKRNSLSMFSLQTGDKKKLADRNENNLVFGRGYVLKDVRDVELKSGGSVKLIRLLNSWEDVEWNGPYCDNSKEWQNVTPDAFRSLNFKFAIDGDFWMPMEECFKQFTDIDTCHLISKNLRSWNCFTIRSDWGLNPTRTRKMPSAGGSYEYTQSYTTNPQILITVNTEVKNPVSICLEQGDISTACRKEEQAVIGLDLYAVEVNRSVRLKDLPRQEWLRSYVNHRQQPSAFISTNLNKGAFVVIPSTLLPNVQQNFCLRILSQNPITVKPLDKETRENGSCCNCCYRKIVGVTQFSIDAVKGLQSYLKHKSKGSIYFSVYCESVDALSTWESALFYPNEKDEYKVNFRVLLYRKNFKGGIVVRVYSKSAVEFDGDHIGTIAFNDLECKNVTIKEGNLQKGKKSLPVTVTASIHMSGDPNYF